MADIELVIKIPEGLKNDFVFEHWTALSCMTMKTALERAIQLPKGHGKLVDISKIDEDRIESDNPIIYLTINGQYTEAISLEYLNDLPTIIEADKEEQG